MTCKVWWDRELDQVCLFLTVSFDTWILNNVLNWRILACVTSHCEIMWNSSEKNTVHTILNIWNRFEIEIEE